MGPPMMCTYFSHFVFNKSKGKGTWAGTHIGWQIPEYQQKGNEFISPHKLGFGLPIRSERNYSLSVSLSHTHTERARARARTHTERERERERGRTGFMLRKTMTSNFKMHKKQSILPFPTLLCSRINLLLLLHHSVKVQSSENGKEYLKPGIK